MGLCLSRRWCHSLPALCLAAVAAATGPLRAEEARPPAKVDFARDVAPVLKARCVECHGPSKKRGGVRLDTPAGLRGGGASGALWVAGKPDESLLIRCVRGVGDAPRMPPKGEPLADASIAVLRAWIEQGAEMPAGGGAVAKTAAPGEDGRWALRPLKRPAVPTPPPAMAAWVRSPVDAFIAERLASNGLRPSPEADRRLLARRVAIDLTGLPPTPEELDAFLADPAPDAYERWVDRLLASPRYGERWARHWLDVAHYADSHGQDQDRFRPNAWPYRDYLIRAFNSDNPYGRFVREQIAGDVLHPGDPDALVATGFLAAGPWDESGLRDINENSPDRLAARYLDRDDIVTSTMTTFAGLTVHCARCHDHKFDPITQADYYALQAVFAGIDKAERAYDPDPNVAARRAELTAALARLRGPPGAAAIPATAESEADPAAFEAERRDIGGLWIVPEPEGLRSKNGAVLSATPDRSVLSGGTAPDRDTYTVTLTTDRAAPTALRLEVLCDDSLPHRGPGRQGNGNLHLSEIRVRVHPKGQPEKAVAVKLKSASADFDQAGWAVPRAIDGDPTTAWGIYPEVGRPHEAVFEFDKPVGFEGGTVLTVELDQLHGGNHLIGRFRLSVTDAPFGERLRPLPAAIAAALSVPAKDRTDRQRGELGRWLAERRLQRELAALPPQAKVYCGTNRFAPDGSFRPSDKPRPVHLLHRGDPAQPRAAAVPGAVEAVPGLAGRFALTNPDDEGARRAALAAWLSDPANPLTWRVIANRVWHHHFGRGIVDTPNDFGRMGGRPSHPELLDWLAVEFRDGGGSLKSLHRLLVTSATYRQAVRHDAEAAARDADNRLLWRMNRGRLDAETVRDAVLLIAGRLDETMYGPPVRHFLSKPGLHVTPTADYNAFDVDSPAARRRSIYRFIFRTCPDPMLEALDCPDASASAPVRSVSVGPTQALVLWNDKFLLRNAEHLAERAAESAADLDGQVRFAARRVLLRDPTADERAAWADYARRFGTANLCRVLLNSSEFLFID